MLRFLPIALFSTLLLVPSPAPAQDPGQVLQPGDLIRIAVWRQPELSGEFGLAPDSTILHPLYRGVKAAGVPLAVAEERIGDLLRRYEASPQFVVEPLFRVAVGGEVRQPSVYSFPPEVTLARAVALAGGPTERGRMDRVRLVRGGTVALVDLTDPDDPRAREPVRSGDQILLERRRSVFRDYIAPAASVTSAVVTILNLVLR